MTVAETQTQQVPFLDLQTVHAPLREQLLASIAALIDQSAFVNGPAVSDFETMFARFGGSRYCAGVGSGLDALRLGLLAAGIGPGDEVIVPGNTFIATVEAVVQAGGTPVLVDVAERDYNMDPAAVSAAITPRTRFVTPVHLYGQMADMRALGAIARRHGVEVIEDACQAHGASRDGLCPGSVSRAAAFSFYPGKNLGAMGDAGALTTDDGDLADAVRALREHGQREKYVHEVVGYTSRLDALQALVLSHKLPFLHSWNEQRRDIARLYGEALQGVGDLRLPPVPDASRPVWHLYVVRTADPSSLAETLRAQGIATGRHYPEPIHLSAAFAALGYRRGELPVTERLAAELLSLPIFPGMTEGQVVQVVDAVRAHFEFA